MFLEGRAYYILIGLFCLITYVSSSQDQRIADSLTIIYQKEKLEGVEKLELLKNLSFNISDPNLSLKYVEELIVLSKSANEYKYLFNGYYQKGNKFKDNGELEKALTNYFLSLELATEMKYLEGEGSAYVSIADVYTIMENPNNAEK